MGRHRVAAAAACLLLALPACGGTQRAAAPALSLPTAGEAGTPPAATPTPTPTPTRAADQAAQTDEAAALIGRLRAFARQPGKAEFDRIPFADEVALGLGEDVATTLPAEALRSPASWVLDRPGFRAYAGPFDLLEPLRDPRPAEVSVGSHPHCAAPPRAAPDGYEDARRVSTQPQQPDGCLEWYSVDVFLRDGRVTAVTYDLWEP